MGLESSPASDTAPDTPWAWRAIVGAMVGISLVGRQFCGDSAVSATFHGVSDYSDFLGDFWPHAIDS